jgi:hypothetical protein
VDVGAYLILMNFYFNSVNPILNNVEYLQFLLPLWQVRLLCIMYMHAPGPFCLRLTVIDINYGAVLGVNIFCAPCLVSEHL